MSGLTDTVVVKKYDGNAGRILEMLGNGLSPTVVAGALGVTESYVSQLLSEEDFSKQVTTLRFNNLQAATTRDRSYDEIEDELIKKMSELLPLMYKPMEVLRAITVINAAKRRGASAPENTVINNTVVQLSLPITITSRFVKDANNQVVEAGDQQLVTIASTNLSRKLEGLKNGLSSGLAQESIASIAATTSEQ